MTAKQLEALSGSAIEAVGRKRPHVELASIPEEHGNAIDNNNNNNSGESDDEGEPGTAKRPPTGSPTGMLTGTPTLARGDDQRTGESSLSSDWGCQATNIIWEHNETMGNKTKKHGNDRKKNKWLVISNMYSTRASVRHLVCEESRTTLWYCSCSCHYELVPRR